MGIGYGVGLHNYDTRMVSDETATPIVGESLTQQHFTEEVDINVIVRRFGLTGQLPQAVSAGVYGDFTGISDFDSALETIERTRERFMALPAELRERFDNDPAVLVRYAETMSEQELVATFGAGARADLSVNEVVDPPAPAG